MSDPAAGHLVPVLARRVVDPVAPCCSLQPFGRVRPVPASPLQEPQLPVQAELADDLGRDNFGETPVAQRIADFCVIPGTPLLEYDFEVSQPMIFHFFCITSPEAGG